MNKAMIRQYYEDLIQYDFFPYWLRFADRARGGILNCISNDCEHKVSDDKYTWSQGRWLWILGRVYDLAKRGMLPALDQSQIRAMMDETFHFLTTYAIDDDALCCYRLSADGQRIRDDATGRYDASIYADCFALIGVAQYVKSTAQPEHAQVAERLYRSIVKRIKTGTYLTEPYPVPDGYRIHGIPMILVNTVHEYCLMKERLGMDTAQESAYARAKTEYVLCDLYDDRGLIREYVSDSPDASERMLDRHINPGHTLEDAWFLTEYLEQYGGLEDFLPRITKIVKTVFHLGWDETYGGLLRFVDIEGGMPKGKSGDSAYERLIHQTWDMKLWWPHSEILYLFLKMYEVTGDRTFLSMYETAFTYVMQTFPNRKTGEWIQIRNRNGTPEEKLVALPVKDPFHILRNFIKIVELYAA